MNCTFFHIKRTLIFIGGNINFMTSKIIKWKIIKFFHCLCNLTIKALSFKILKKAKKYCVVIGGQNENTVCNLNWKLYLFDFDARYRDLNLTFVFDSSTRTFLTNDIFIKAANIVNNEYLRYGKNFDINAFFTSWFVSKKREWSSNWLLWRLSKTTRKQKNIWCR